MTQQLGQILVDNLFLQGNSRGGHHQFFTHRLGNGNRRQKIRNGFTGTSSRLHHTHVSGGGTAIFVVQSNGTECPGNFSNHQLLPVTRLHAFALQKLAVSALDLLLELVG